MSSTDAGGDAHHNYHNHHSNHLPVPIELNDSSSEYSIQEPSHDVFSSDPSDDDDEDDDEDVKSDISMSEYSGLDEIPFTRADVMKWSPSDVSSYFKSRQMSPGICAKFEEQEVSGAILLELEMSHLKELELGSFGKRFEVWKEIEHLVKNLKQYSAPSKPRSGSDAASRQTRCPAAYTQSACSTGIAATNDYIPGNKFAAIQRIGIVVTKIFVEYNVAPDITTKKRLVGTAKVSAYVTAKRFSN
ncbi:Similar to Protein BOI2; acc. no. P39969 [Pyronema omphalodes CBS 100304]|uniref:Similar to Protein BOI2 acc. no. P39969 n=1 Tax=Pyronema omphalodes (strain CBS 100304) TaxID=1076935 RepID=U4KYG2_PYROM|nr:Similar to Protein BOI2; acc. no. P39969 [Pyronema omphalodes CBS 100304]